MNIAQYLDSTYLKLPQQANISEKETREIVFKLVNDAIENNIFAVMIRPHFVKEVKKYMLEQESTVKVGTVIGFHEGEYSLSEKMEEAQKAITDGADELDFVINYPLYIQKGFSAVEEEVVMLTRLCLENGKIAKWIIEIAALNDSQISDITSKIAETITREFSGQENKVFIKSSTGFFKTPNGEPNGATEEGIKIMLKHAGKLPVKAAGGVRNVEEANRMVALGVQRIGTSSALEIIKGNTIKNDY